MIVDSVLTVRHVESPHGFCNLGQSSNFVAHVLRSAVIDCYMLNLKNLINRFLLKKTFKQISERYNFV